MDSMSRSPTDRLRLHLPLADQLRRKREQWLGSGRARRADGKQGGLLAFSRGWTVCSDAAVGFAARRVARWARLQHFPADSVIIQQGDPGSDFYILASGRVTVRVEVAMGIRRFLGYRGAGFFFGETALLTGDRRNATITAVESSEVFVFDKESFDKLHNLHPRIEEEIRLRMEARLRLTRILTAST